MPNVPIVEHDLIGRKFIYRADIPALPPYKYASALVIAPQMEVQVVSVFENWNDVKGLDMLFVFVKDTGLHTHVTPDSLGIKKITSLPSQRHSADDLTTRVEPALTGWLVTVMDRHGIEVYSQLFHGQTHNKEMAASVAVQNYKEGRR